jgi:hypothetical protein
VSRIQVVEDSGRQGFGSFSVQVAHGSTPSHGGGLLA